MQNQVLVQVQICHLLLRNRSALFHVCVIVNHTKIDTLFDSGSQVNMISEEVVKKLHLVTMPHEKPCPLGWVTNDTRLQVTKKCVLKLQLLKSSCMR